MSCYKGLFHFQWLCDTRLVYSTGNLEVLVVTGMCSTWNDFFELPVMTRYFYPVFWCPSRVGECGPALAGKAKTGMERGWTRAWVGGWLVKL